MSKNTKSNDGRTTVAIDDTVYDQFSIIARHLRRTVKECAAEAIEQWSARNRKRVGEETRGRLPD